MTFYSTKNLLNNKITLGDGNVLELMWMEGGSCGYPNLVFEDCSKHTDQNSSYCMLSGCTNLKADKLCFDQIEDFDMDNINKLEHRFCMIMIKNKKNDSDDDSNNDLSYMRPSAILEGIVDFQ